MVRIGPCQGSDPGSNPGHRIERLDRRASGEDSEAGGLLSDQSPAEELARRSRRENGEARARTVRTGQRDQSAHRPGGVARPIILPFRGEDPGSNPGRGMLVG